MSANSILRRKALAIIALIAFATSICVLSLGSHVAPSFGADSGTQDMLRLYNPNSGEHFYTANSAEKDNLVAVGWKYEGIGWVAPQSSSTPVYRLYSGTDHHYTKDANEKASLEKAGWKYEGIGWYSSDDSKSFPLYRQYNPNVNPKAMRNNAGSHNYTTSKGENDSLVRVGWRGEGIGWYAIGEGTPVVETSSSGSSNGGASAVQSDSVLVTKTGSKYHRTSGCRSTASSTSTSIISLAEAQRRGLTPCSNCYH